MVVTEYKNNGHIFDVAIIFSEPVTDEVASIHAIVVHSTINASMNTSPNPWLLGLLEFQGFSAFLAASAGLLRQRAVMRRFHSGKKNNVAVKSEKTVCVNY